MANPIPADWQWLAVILRHVCPHLWKGKVLFFLVMHPIAPHFALGGSALIMKLNSFVNVIPSEQAINKLNLKTPGNQVVLIKLFKKFIKK